MTFEEILKEYEKGCSNTIGGKPSDCKECLDAAVRALKFWAKANENREDF